MQLISIDKTSRSNTVQVLKEVNSQSSATQAKEGEQLVSMMPAIKEGFYFLGDDLVELYTEHVTLKNKTDDFDEKWLQESNNKLLEQIDDEKRANLILSRMKKQMEKH